MHLLNYKEAIIVFLNTALLIQKNYYIEKKIKPKVQYNHLIKDYTKNLRKFYKDYILKLGDDKEKKVILDMLKVFEDFLIKKDFDKFRSNVKLSFYKYITTFQLINNE